MIGITQGNSLEALCLNLKTRKFYPQLPYKHETLGKTVYPFKLGIRSEAHIEEAYPGDHKFIFEHSMRKNGDALHGETISGFSSKLIRPEVNHGSASHKASFARAKAGSYAAIDIPVRDYIEKKKITREDRKQLK